MKKRKGNTGTSTTIDGKERGNRRRKGMRMRKEFCT